MLEAARAAMPELRPPARNALSATWASAPSARISSLSGSSWATSTSARSPAAAPIRWRWQTGFGGELVARTADADPAASLVTPAALSALVAMVSGPQPERDGCARGARRAGGAGRRPRDGRGERGLGALDDDTGLAAIVARVIAEDPAAAEKVRAGNPKAIGALVGPIMRETRGRADGAEVTRLIRDALGLEAIEGQAPSGCAACRGACEQAKGGDKAEKPACGILASGPTTRAGCCSNIPSMTHPTPDPDSCSSRRWMRRPRWSRRRSSCGATALLAWHPPRPRVRAASVPSRATAVAPPVSGRSSAVASRWSVSSSV